MNIKWVPSPCKDCQKRHEKCHASCKEYADYLKRHRAEKERMYQEDMLDKLINHMNYESIKKRDKIPEPLRHGRKKK